MLRANVRTQNKKSGRERVLRRQTELGGHSAGSSRTARLDPLALPVRFTASDAVADERVRHVELHPRARDPAPCRARHAHRAQRSGAGIPRRLDPAHRRSRTIAPAGVGGLSRTPRSGALDRALFRARTPTTSSPNGNCGRACSACRAGRRQRRRVQRAVPAARRGALQGAGATPPPPFAAEQAPPALPGAPPCRRERASCRWCIGRARDHRAQTD